jgi:signal transduction histidine kinase
VSLGLILIYCNIAVMALAVFTAVNTVRLRKLPAIRWLLLLTLAFFVGSFAALNIFLAEDFGQKILFFYIRTWGMVFVCPLWLLFNCSVFGRWGWLQKNWVAGLILAPSIVNLSMAVVPAWRPLLFIDFEPLHFHGSSVLQFKHGPSYVPFYYWSMTLFLASFVVSAIAFFHESGYRRRQILALNAGLGAGLVSFFAPNSANFDWILASSFSILFTQLGVVYAVIWHRLLNIVPLAMFPIFQKMPDPALVIDDRHRLMAANDEAVQFFGLAKDYLGKSVSELLPTVSLEAGERAIAGASNLLRHFHVAVEKVGVDAGSVVYFRDVGVQKAVEVRLTEGLEFRAQLLALLAHDLTGFAENQTVLSRALLAEADPGTLSRLELLNSSAHATQDLVSNVMSWAKSQPTHFQAEKRSFEWNTLLREAVEQMDSRLAVGGVEVIFTSSQASLLCDGDSEMLASVLRNVLSNSLRASARGKRIFLNLRGEKQSVKISIRDEGGGMGSEKLEAVRKASKEFILSGVSKTHGAGIGLMIARYFVSLHEGRFEINSELGAGTEVSISIPL